METPRLHPDTIEEVKQRVDIVDVISEQVVLRKRGKDYQGLCPFHEEKTPSFTVSPSKQLYYCFGCGAGGGTFNFLMEVGKQSFSEVVLELAQRYQVPVQTLEPEQRQELQRQLSLQEKLYEILAVSASFYQHALQQPPGKVALDYLKSERQLSEETIKQFQLGYAPAGWETLYRYLVEQKRYSFALVEEAGLIQQRKSGHGYYDRFRNRVIIPIRDNQGRVIGFGSRTLADVEQKEGEEQKKEPKYLNSPETPLFDKSKTLFALDIARSEITKQDQAVVVEGYFDAIALHAAGIKNVVASLGTAFSAFRQLLRYTESKQIILNFDADTAGTTATQRVIREAESLVYTGQLQLRVLNLPDGKDADDFLQSAPDAPEKYRQLLRDAPLWLDWQISQLLVGQDLKQADQFQRVAQNMVQLLNHLANANQRGHYIHHCAELLSQGDSRLIPLYAEKLQAQLKKPQRRSGANKPDSQEFPASSERNLLERAEALLLRIYLHCPQHRQEIIEALDEKDLTFNFSHHRFLWQQILELQTEAQESGRGQGENLQPSTFNLQPSTQNQLLSLLQERSADFPEKMAQVAHLFYLDEIGTREIIRTPLVMSAAIATLERVLCEKYKRYCLEQWQQLHPESEPERREYYYQEFYNAHQKIKELDQQRQFSIIDIIESPSA